MLRIRQEQIDQLEQGVMREVENRMVAHVRQYLPRYIKLLGEERLRTLARRALGRASAQGMVTESSATLFLDLMLLLGSDFDSDPQLPFVARVLGDPALGDEIERAAILYREAKQYRAAVAGENSEHMLAALRRLRDFPLTWAAPHSPDEFREQLIWRLRELFPEKAADLGEAGLNHLLRRSFQAAAECGLRSVPAVALVSALMLVAGTGILDDPRFPVVREIISDQAADPAQRLARLQAAMVAEIDRWLAARS